MIERRPCARRRVAIVCACVGVLVASAGARAESARVAEARDEPLVVREGSSVVYAYAPASAPGASGARPAVVYLHGRCGAASNGCPHFRAGSEPFGWLVCPQANVACPAGGASWGGSAGERASLVDAAVSAVSRARPGAVDDAAPGVLVGFSLGAWTALDVARARPGRYPALLLIGAQVEPAASELRAAGVARVVLAAGRLDMAYRAMRARAARLAADGVDARFVDLGRVGHTYAAENPEALDDALAWLERRADRPDARPEP